MKTNIGIMMAIALSALEGKGSGTEYDPDDQIGSTTQPIPKGHRQFWINGVEVWALNRKNAYKKYHRENAPLR